MFRCTDAKRQRCEASIEKFFPLLGEGLRERVLLEGRKLRRYDGRPLTVTKVTNPFLPLLGKDKRMGNNQYPPQPSLIREGELPLFVIADSEADPQSQNSSKTNRLSPLPSHIGEWATHVAHSHNIRRVAFTLAEVLITLGIIGVVAAMTIPTLIHKFQNKALETQYKKAVSIVSQVILKAKADIVQTILIQVTAVYLMITIKNAMKFCIKLS